MEDVQQVKCELKKMKQRKNIQRTTQPLLSLNCGQKLSVQTLLNHKNLQHHI